MIEGAVPGEILAGPDAIRDTVRAVRPAAASLARTLLDRGVRRVHVIGNGTSYHSALAATVLHRRHARPTDPAVVPLTAGEFRTYPPALGHGDAVVGISSSGEFRDVVGVVESLRGRVPTVGIVNVADSSLARVADHILQSAAGPSPMPVMTKTFSATLVATELLLLELLGEEVAAPVEAAMIAAADDAARAVEAAGAAVEGLAERFADCRHFFVVGAGAAHPAALEAALKLKEMALVHAEGVETWEMASGPATLVGPATTIVALEPAGPGLAATRDIVRHCAGWGARVIEVGPDRTVPEAELLPVPPTAIEDHAPLTVVPPVALFAYALARRHGIQPDRPAWTDRYRSQGLTHIPAT